MPQTGRPLHAVVVVAFQRSDGRVVGTFVHGSDGPDPAGAERSRERFMGEMQAHLGQGADLDSILVPLQELGGGWVHRVDPQTRTVVPSAPRHRGPAVLR